MSDLQDIYDRLRRPFPTSAISWRVGVTSERDGKTVGLPLAYIDARDVMDRLDEVVTPGGWQAKYPETNTKTVCALGISVGGEWVWKEDGAGDTDFEAEKGALSDAFKRAAVRWGVGRYLYGLKSKWVEVEKRGKSFVIPDASRNELDAQHDAFIETMEWGERQDRLAYRLVVAAMRAIDVHELAKFEDENEGNIAGLPVAMRNHLRQHLNRLRSGMDHQQKEAAE